MARYSVQPEDRIFENGYKILSFTKNMSKNIGKNTSKYLIGKYGQKLLDHAKQSAIDALKTSSKRVVQRTANATGDLIGNNIANRITKVSKNSQRSVSETVTNGDDKEIPKKGMCLQKKGKKLLLN